MKWWNYLLNDFVILTHFSPNFVIITLKIIILLFYVLVIMNVLLLVFFRSLLKGNHYSVRKSRHYKPMVPDYGGYMTKYYCNYCGVRVLTNSSNSNIHL